MDREKEKEGDKTLSKCACSLITVLLSYAGGGGEYPPS